MSVRSKRLPPWLKRPWPTSDSFQHTEETLSSLRLETICTNANCPNRGECWGRGTATSLILGNVCTRHCRFCSVATGKPEPPDPTEPARLAEMVKRMHIHYLVLTSVTRDDLPDGGARHFCDCIGEVRRQRPSVKFEILVPDFRGCQVEALNALEDAMPFVFAHNVEMVPSLYPKARSGGDYQLSLGLLSLAKQRFPDLQTKSSIMLGIGESDEEVRQVLIDLRNAGCDRVTIGQYLRPSRDSLDVVEYIHPDQFVWWATQAKKLGFSWVESSPFARSSYFAEREAEGI
jgi:lipoic acid synthetase